jgi:hypothetical protein
MSFGISISDFVALISLAKTAVERCRNAPSEFSEAGRIAESLFVTLSSIQAEVENPQPLLHQDDRNVINFTILAKNYRNSQNIGEHSSSARQPCNKSPESS